MMTRAEVPKSESDHHHPILVRYTGKLECRKGFSIGAWCHMAAEFDESGIQFRYPENWRLEREENDAGWTVMLQSPDTAFMTVTLDDEMPNAENMAEAALSALREVYPDLEADDCVDTVAGQPAVGHDIRFFSLDLTNTAWTRSFYSAQGTVLILCQTNDLELEKHEPVLRAICASVKLEED